MEPGKKDVALFGNASYLCGTTLKQTWSRRLSTKQQRWEAKARKAGLRRRTYLIPDHLDDLMLKHINSNQINPFCTSKSDIVRTALEKFFDLEKPNVRAVDS